jgi:acylphosphatase
VKQHLTIQISGFVQGVSFRYFACQTAAKLAVTGFVKNESNGTVLIEAEGDKKALEKFVSTCRRGPLFALVTQVDTKVGKLKNYPDFKII